jgi:hypothetical protein
MQTGAVSMRVSSVLRSADATKLAKWSTRLTIVLIVSLIVSYIILTIVKKCRKTHTVGVCELWVAEYKAHCTVV